jgi:hypothetical protein
MSKPDEEGRLRSEFWSAPAVALVDRATVAASQYKSLAWAEQLAIKGGGPPFLKIGRRCLYRKSDVLAWMEKNGQFVDSTAELV